MPKRPAAISNELKTLGKRLTEFRHAHPPRSRLPEGLWEAATSLGNHEGLYRTARVGASSGHLAISRPKTEPPQQPDPDKLTVLRTLRNASPRLSYWL